MKSFSNILYLHSLQTQAFCALLNVIFLWQTGHSIHFLICFIALTIIRIIQYKILKYENKSTLNVDGWEQGITAEKLKEE